MREFPNLTAETTLEFSNYITLLAVWLNMATAEVVAGAVKSFQDDGKGKKEDGTTLEPKDFFWDQFLKYISSAILALTVLNVSVEFLRGGGVQCFPPTNIKLEDYL